MKFKVLIDQANAIRFGANCGPVARIDVDVSKLSTPVRFFIAERFWKGWIKVLPVDEKNGSKVPPLVVLGASESDLRHRIQKEMEKLRIWTAWTTEEENCLKDE